MAVFMPYSPSGGANLSARAAQSDARSAKSEVNILRFEVERLLMITEALWTILKEQHGFDDAELIDKINEIDLRDGRLDGRVAVSAEPAVCPNCGRTLSKRRPVCLYCSTSVVQDPFER